MTEAIPVVITVTHQVLARPEHVFRAWTDPTLIGRWMFGPTIREETVLRLSTDPHRHGRFSFLVKQQGQEYDHVGSYLIVEKPTRLAFTWGIAGHSADESTVTVQFDSSDDGTQMHLTHEMDPRWSEYAERTQQGWTRMLDSLGRFLTASP